MEQNILKYRRPDVEGGFIYDKVDIDYYRTTQRNDVIDNSLLGDFNMVGSYVVNNAIIQELLKMQKVYEDSYAKSIFCESVKQFDGQSIKFRLNILTGSPAGKVTASLELLEEISRTNGYYKNTNSVLIDSRVFANSKDVENKIFKAYNIIKNLDDSGAKKESDFEFSNVIRRKQMLTQLRNMTYGLNFKSEKELFDQRIEILKANSKCAPLLEEFNRQIFHIKDKFLDKNDRLYYRHLNQVLDGVLDMYGYLIADEKETIRSLKRASSNYVDKQAKIDLVTTSEVEKQYEMRDRQERAAIYKQDEKNIKQEVESKSEQNAQENKIEKPNLDKEIKKEKPQFVPENKHEVPQTNKNLAKAKQANKSNINIKEQAESHIEQKEAVESPIQDIKNQNPSNSSLSKMQFDKYTDAINAENAEELVQ